MDTERPAGFAWRAVARSGVVLPNVSVYAYTAREMARRLACSSDDVHATVDRLGIPYDIRDGVNKHGEPIVRRVYLKAPVDEFFLEWGRVAARKAKD